MVKQGWQIWFKKSKTAIKRQFIQRQQLQKVFTAPAATTSVI